MEKRWPFPVIDPANALLMVEQLWNDLISSPVGLNKTHPKAIEFAFANGDGTTHWIACPISDSTPPFNLDKDKLFETLSLFCASRDANYKS